MKLRIFISIILFSFISCREQEVRRPITASKTHLLTSTVEALREINKIEEAKIEKYIENDSLHKYTRSSNGFWYRYITKIEKDMTLPKKDNIVELSYDFIDLDNQIIYSNEQIGIVKYIVDKEDFIPGLQKGIKMMKPGETVKFIFPSFNAFGVLGDNNKIGMNQSIISRVTLINIK
ncbi:MAG: putative FKBP-type peptidyl-prolyl cis-trans isomerase FkpA [Flavobacterium sp. SCGC AAA160-P02]|nr:MAG: putative FKBP-type peptidyl-prolyl cis-trans isomerase FkpA [Flavobacterium sp. SCGC AAA160-P02]